MWLAVIASGEWSMPVALHSVTLTVMGSVMSVMPI
jgi:hypothetical protein